MARGGLASALYLNKSNSCVRILDFISPGALVEGQKILLLLVVAAASDCLFSFSCTSTMYAFDYLILYHWYISLKKGASK